VVEGDRVRLQEIATGEMQENSVAVTAGLQPGQRIVTAGVNRLADGQRVALDEPPGLLARQP
jgi:multidrug efflux pump subunit AcrA (membrane-fusion protein)